MIDHGDNDSPVSACSPTTLLKRYGLWAKKSWGQCFLHDPTVTARIVTAAGIEPDDVVVEIGAGLGVLTAALAQRAARVVAIERDRDLVGVLQAELGDLDKIEIVAANALTFTFDRFEAPVVVVGNLPYNISSQLLFHLIDQRGATGKIRSATLMLQREVGERIAAPAGSRTYGAPSVICQHHAEVSRCLRVGRGAFTPAPRVDSIVIKLVFREVGTPPLFAKVVSAAFAQRRKTLRRALSSQFERERVERALSSAGIDARTRAENLDVDTFVALARALEPAS